MRGSCAVGRRNCFWENRDWRPIVSSSPKNYRVPRSSQLLPESRNYHGRQITEGSSKTSVTEESQDRQCRSEEEAGPGGQSQSEYWQEEVAGSLRYFALCELAGNASDPCRLRRSSRMFCSHVVNFAKRWKSLMIASEGTARRLKACHQPNRRSTSPTRSTSRTSCTACGFSGCR